MFIERDIQDKKHTLDYDQIWLERQVFSSSKTYVMEMRDYDLPQQRRKICVSSLLTHSFTFSSPSHVQLLSKIKQPTTSSQSCLVYTVPRCLILPRIIVKIPRLYDAWYKDKHPSDLPMAAMNNRNTCYSSDSQWEGSQGKYLNFSEKVQFKKACSNLPLVLEREGS